MIHTIQDIYSRLHLSASLNLVIANGIDGHSIEAAAEATRLGIVNVILVGDEKLILEQCKLLSIQADQFDVIHQPDSAEALKYSLLLVRAGMAQLVMKGLVSTDQFMKAVLNKEFGLLPPKTLLSHITLMQHQNYHKLILISDVAIIPAPTLAQKQSMTRYLIDAAHKLGIDKPKVAFIAATEQAIVSMPACADAVHLKQLFSDSDAWCDGPMGLDLAIDQESVQIKGFDSEVAGDADCLLFPNIESGNVFYKTSTKLCGAETAAVVVGTQVPVILSSRGDTMQTKLNSIALAALLGS